MYIRFYYNDIYYEILILITLGHHFFVILIVNGRGHGPGYLENVTKP